MDSFCFYDNSLSHIYSTYLLGRTLKALVISTVDGAMVNHWFGFLHSVLQSQFWKFVSWCWNTSSATEREHQGHKDQGVSGCNENLLYFSFWRRNIWNMTFGETIMIRLFWIFEENKMKIYQIRFMVSSNLLMGRGSV